MQHPQHTGAIGNLMQSLNPNQAGNSSRSKYVQDLGLIKGKAKVGGMPFNYVVDKIDLLQGLKEGWVVRVGVEVVAFVRRGTRETGQ